MIDQKVVKGVKQFLIRWKGYGANSDTWEPESTLSCPELTTKFITSKEKKPKGRPSRKSKQDDSEDGGEADEEVTFFKISLVGEYKYIFLFLRKKNPGVVPPRKQSTMNPTTMMMTNREKNTKYYLISVSL